MMAAFLLGVVIALAIYGYFALAWFVAGKTNNRLSGWAIYAAIMALPAYALYRVVPAAVAVILERA